MKLSTTQALKQLIFILAAITVFSNRIASQIVGEDILKTVHYRSIGPTRQSGRFVDLAVCEKKPSVFYAAMASGGLWKTIKTLFSR